MIRPVLLLLLMVLVSLYATFDIELSFSKIAGVVLGIAAFYTAVAYAREHTGGVWRVLAFVLLAGAVMAAIGFLNVRWSGPLSPLNQINTLLPGPLGSLPGTVGGVVNPNQLAGMLAWAAPLAWACVVGLRKPLWQGKKLLWLLLLGIALFSTLILVGTQSRGGVLALAGALLIMLAIPFRWGRILLVIALIGFILLLIYFDIGSLIVNGSGGINDFGLQGRLEIWSRAIYGLQDFPFTGMSMNGFRRVVHILYPLFTIAPDVDLGHAHNHLLQAGLDLGLPGLIAYLALWFVSAALLWLSWRGLDNGPVRTLVVGLAGALTAGWLFGLLDAVALGARPGFIWWLLLALVVGVFDQAYATRE